MTDEAAIKATFSEWRMVKGRKVLQLIFETPLERQGEVLTMLGAPMPDKEIWCAIAKLASPSPPSGEGRPGVETGISPTARARASERYAGLPPMKQASEDAGMLAKDERFQVWACEQDYRYGPPTEFGAAQYIRDHCCKGATRKHIAADPEAYRKFLALERLFHEAIGVIPEMRS